EHWHAGYPLANTPVPGMGPAFQPARLSKLRPSFCSGVGSHFICIAEEILGNLLRRIAQVQILRFVFDQDAAPILRYEFIPVRRLELEFWVSVIGLSVCDESLAHGILNFSGSQVGDGHAFSSVLLRASRAFSRILLRASRAFPRVLLRAPWAFSRILLRASRALEKIRSLNFTLLFVLEVGEVDGKAVAAVVRRLVSDDNLP